MKKLPVTAFTDLGTSMQLAMMGMPMMNAPAISTITCPQEADCAWSSPIYPMTQENTLQRFRVPPTLCDGCFLVVRVLPTIGTCFSSRRPRQNYLGILGTWALALQCLTTCCSAF